ETGIALHPDREAEPRVMALRRLLLEVEEVAVLGKLAAKPGRVLAADVDELLELWQLHQAHRAGQLHRPEVVAHVHEQEARVELGVLLEPAVAVLDLAHPAMRAQD